VETGLKLNLTYETPSGQIVLYEYPGLMRRAGLLLKRRLFTIEELSSLDVLTAETLDWALSVFCCCIYTSAVRVERTTTVYDIAFIRHFIHNCSSRLNTMKFLMNAFVIAITVNMLSLLAIVNYSYLRCMVLAYWLVAT